MNKNYTLKELADIGLSAACQFEPNSKFPLSFQNYREAFVKAILDAVGYEFPKDEEREAFERWQKSHTVDPNDAFFDVWKAGREELRRAQSLDKQPTEPAWIPWGGGECPLPDGVEFEFKIRDGGMSGRVKHAPMYNWGCHNSSGDIVAYRVFEG